MLYIKCLSLILTTGAQRTGHVNSLRKSRLLSLSIFRMFGTSVCATSCCERTRIVQAKSFQNDADLKKRPIENERIYIIFIFHQKYTLSAL